MNLFDVRTGPSHTGDSNLAVGGDPENGGDVGQSVGIRDRVSWVFHEYGKCDAKFFQEGVGVALVVLRNSDDGHTFAAGILVNPLQEWKRVLANRARNFEECSHDGTFGQGLFQGKRPSIHGG